MGSIDKACISGFLCRLCSEMHRTVIHIYGEQGKKHGLVEKINGYLPINVSPHDPLPKTICETCLRRVEQHYELLSRLEEYRDSKLMRNMSGLRPRLLRIRAQNHDTGGISILGTTSLSTFRTSNATAVSGSGSASTDTRNNAASTSLSLSTSTVSASGSNNDHRSVHNDDANEDNDDNMQENVTTEYQVITHPNSPPFYPPHLSPSSSSVQFSPLSGPSSPNDDPLIGRNVFLSTNTSPSASSSYTQAPTRLCTMMVQFNDDDGDDENDEDEDDDDDDDDDDDEDDDDDDDEEEEEEEDDDNNNDEDEDEEDEDDSQNLRNIEQQESLQSENNEPNTNTRRNEGDVTLAHAELDYINLFFR